jgi:hypothetical protein
MGTIGLVLFRMMVTQADLVLVIEPLLVVVGARGVEHPLREALAHCRGVIGIDLMRLGILVVAS